MKKTFSQTLLKFCLLLLVMFMPATVISQITVQPQFCTATDSITVIFDASAGNGELLNVAAPLYAHVGVITDKSTSLKDWKYVRTKWGQDDSLGKMKQIATNVYSFSLRPSTFFGVPAGEKILYLAFVFRNVNGTKVGRASDGGDIYAKIYELGVNVQITQPLDKQVFVNLNDNISARAVASSENVRLKFLLNSQVVDSTNTDSLNVNFAVTDSNGYVAKFVAQDVNGATASDSFQVVVRPRVNVAPVPNGAREGITYTSDTSAILVLFAPFKNYVYVIGDFNNWEVNNQFKMNRTPDSSRYWIEIKNLQKGVEYAYQYLVDGTIRVADPFAHKMLDPQNDGGISAERYPNLKKYPTGKTTEIVSVLQTSEPQYQWKNVNLNRPRSSNLVIYELLVRDFTNSSSYKTLIDSLGYLQKLGVNAIQLMPPTEFEGNDSWGYNISFFLAPDKYYGPANELKRFIDSCHSLGIAVIMDAVLNHAFGQSSTVRLWGTTAGVYANNPYHNVVAKHPFNVGYDFNHESPATQELVRRFCEYWLTEFRFDGFRFDLSKGFTQFNSGSDVGLWGRYDSSRVRIWKRIYNEIRAIDSSAYVILEHFADNSEERELSDYGMMFWGNMNGAIRSAAKGNTSGEFSGLTYKGRSGWTKPNLVGYAESHDEERVTYDMLTNGLSSGAYNVKDTLTALERMKLVGAFLCLTPGPKMIWQFGELGYDVSINFNGRLGRKPLPWNDFQSKYYRSNVYRAYSTFLNFRKKYTEIFVNGDFDLQTAFFCKTLSLRHPSMNVGLVGNFYTQQAQTINSNFLGVGTWYEYFTGQELTVTSLSDRITLRPGEIRLYTNQKLPLPGESIINSVEENTLLNIESIDNQQLICSPNPVVSGEIEISFHAPKEAHYELQIIDFLGRAVEQISFGKLLSGSYSMKLAMQGYTSGQYTVIISANSLPLIKQQVLMIR